ncbi:NAD(P)/FAD-dependent oxidoreductase [Fibrobacter intestinalis]|nr:NAD(P)/FAD-dependent oxidoreductase [Fibrobacter intestinalis]
MATLRQTQTMLLNPYHFRELSVPLSQKGQVAKALAHALNVREDEIFNLEVERFALDSRKRNSPHWSYNVRFEIAKRLPPTHWLVPATEKKETLDSDAFKNSIPLSRKVHVVGAGPAGLWAALSLARKGFSVELYEQGSPVEERFQDIHRFFGDRKFNPHSNILFGEGGAGAYSDGKLNTRTRNLYSSAVLEDMVRFGVSKDVLTFAKPHIGTDRLVLLLRALRAEFLSLGGTLHFHTALEDIDISGGEISRLQFNGKWTDADALVLAPGHSARNLYSLLHERGVALESKAFALGVRVEHPQSLINLRQLGPQADTRLTGSAEYALTAKTLGGTSAAYSFCMCPGGVLVPCVSENETLATNGMSYSQRNGKFANGAIVVPIPQSKTLFGGIEMQRRFEKAAFELGGRNYTAPAQTIRSFLEGKIDAALPKSTFSTGVVPADIREILDANICNSLADGFEQFERKIPGFIREGLIVAPETRTSSPLRILRNPETLESISVKGLFVLGEGAGYTGGIVTSAADGIKLANRAKALNC